MIQDSLPRRSAAMSRRISKREYQVQLLFPLLVVALCHSEWVTKAKGSNAKTRTEL